MTLIGFRTDTVSNAQIRKHLQKFVQGNIKCSLFQTHNSFPYNTNTKHNITYTTPYSVHSRPGLTDPKSLVFSSPARVHNKRLVPSKFNESIIELQ